MPPASASPATERGTEPDSQRVRQPDVAARAAADCPHVDRWAWRARVRRNPATHRVYRVAVGVLGVLLLLLALVTGPLPGPGGIPLALLALAVLASEFAWAARLLDRLRAESVRAAAWVRRRPAWVQRLGAVATAGVVVAVGYVCLLVLGLPAWLPAAVQAPLQSLPGL
jgi:uncharacterized protein (TIGR02611 family)